MRGPRAALARRPFGRLLAAYTINQTGDNVGLIALAVLVYSETRDPLATTALFICAQFLPAFAAPVLTAAVDARPVRRVLPLLYLAEAVIFAVTALLADRAFLLPAVLALAALDGVLMLTARGLIRGALDAVLSPAGLLREGNGLVNVGFAFASVGGAALGGLLVDQVGVAAALLLDAASFLVIGALLAATRGLPEGPAHVDTAPEAEQVPSVAERPPAAGRLAEGLAFARRDRTVRALLVGQSLALVLFTLIVPIEVVYAAETLGTDETGYGLLLASWGAGVVVGSGVFLLVRGQSARRLVVGSTLAIGVAYLGMGLVDVLWAACLLSVLGGTGNGIQWVSVMTALQEATPGPLQARITGLLESVASAATGVGFLLGGVLTALASPPAAFVTAGVGLIVLVAAYTSTTTGSTMGRRLRRS